jgi:LacI family transcriptional regulator
VSRVLNNHPRVRPETAQQVKRVLDDLGYVRPIIRRGPRLGRRNGRTTGTIAVMALGDPGHARFRLPLFAGVLDGIVRAARDQDLNTLVDTVGGPHELSPAVRDGEVDGALYVGSPLIEPFLSFMNLIKQQVPVVRVMGDALGMVDIDHVGPDNLTVGLLAYQYLAQRGCNPVAFVSTTPPRDVIRTRAMGFIAAANENGVMPDCYVVHSSDANAQFSGNNVVQCQSPDDLAMRLVSASPRPSGIFISRDADALEIQPRLQKLGVRVGEDLTIVSCDNDEVRLGLLDPKPASIDLCTEEIGRHALHRLVGRIRKPDEHPVRLLVLPRLTLGSAPPSWERSDHASGTLEAE